MFLQQPYGTRDASHSSNSSHTPPLQTITHWRYISQAAARTRAPVLSQHFTCRKLRKKSVVTEHYRKCKIRAQSMQLGTIDLPSPYTQEQEIHPYLSRAREIQSIGERNVRCYVFHWNLTLYIFHLNLFSGAPLLSVRTCAFVSKYTADKFDARGSDIWVMNYILWQGCSPCM